MHPTAKSMFTDYIRTLTDPFTYPGIKLGCGTMIPTTLAMATARGSVGVNGTDGSFSIGTLTLANTNLTVALVSNVTAATAPAFASYSAYNNTAINLQMTAMRVVSGGLRVFVNCPMTSAPGIIIGTTQSVNGLTPSLLTVNNFRDLPMSEICNSQEMQVCYRPSDNRDFEFTFPNSGLSLASWQGYISGTGWPIGTTVFWEVVYHIEGYQVNTVSSAEGVSAGPTLADFVPNLESAARQIWSRLGPSVVESGKGYLFSKMGRSAGFRTIG